MQRRQRTIRHSQPGKARILGLGGALALTLSSGCDEQQSLSASQQHAPEPVSLSGFTAPLTEAPAHLRVPGEYLVVFADGVAGVAIDAAADRIALAGGENRVLHRYSVIPGFAARLDAAALEGLRRNPGVAYIEENQRVSLNATYPSPADGIDRVDQRAGHDGSYNDYGRTGAGVHVYVLDTGINSRHTEFAGRIGAGFTSIADGRGVEDCHGHGTHVSSTVAGTVYGIAKQATIHPVRVLGCTGSGTWDGVIAGVDFVRNDCPTRGGNCVANMSLGGGSVAAVNQAVANAVNAGTTFVVAAGNSNADACNFSPAGEPKAITVAALDDNDARAGFSNWGNCVDIFAPGVTILGAWVGGNQATQSINGTSMASPHVAGVAAQFLGANPGATPAQVQANLEGSANLECVTDPRGSPNVMLFNDLSQGNHICGNAPASCEGLCGGPGYGCFCDPSCEIYNDCCGDYAEVCK